MSGSSGDGLDIAEVLFQYQTQPDLRLQSFSLLQRDCIDIPDHLKQSLTAAPFNDFKAMLKLDAQFGKWVGQEIKRFNRVHKLDPLFAAVHGHTCVHHPEQGYSFQLGNGAHIAHIAGIPIITDFRMADIAGGGKGAPMAPLADRDLFPGYDAYLNVGGIANLSYKDNTGLVKGHDICPANQLLNSLAGELGMPFDRDGFIASQSNLIPDLMEFLDHFPYYKNLPPKTLDNQFIRKRMIESVLKWKGRVEDKLHTATMHIAKQIIQEVLEYVPVSPSSGPVQVLCTGGGIKNRFLLLNLRKLAKEQIHWVVPENTIVNYKEAILFAYAGLLRLYEQPNFISTVTGAEGDAVGGVVHLPIPTP
jgi:anhydro-N-acetylmuramic acid kinase